MKRVFYLFIIGLLFTSCSDSITEEKLLGKWKVSEIIEVESENSEINDMMESIAREMFISKGYMLNFYSDKVYSDVTGNEYNSGIWSLSGKELNFGENKMTVEKTEVINKKRYLTGIVNLNDSKLKVKLKFVKKGSELKNFKKDPFYPSNNKWRNKPNHSENQEEIVERLLNYIKHLAYIFKASDERGDHIASWKSSYGIIRVFGNGIGIEKIENIDENWINCFYNKEEALKAYEIYKSSFRMGSYNAGESESRFINLYNIIMTVFDTISNNF